MRPAVSRRALLRPPRIAVTFIVFAFIVFAAIAATVIVFTTIAVAFAATTPVGAPCRSWRGPRPG